MRTAPIEHFDVGAGFVDRGRTSEGTSLLITNVVDAKRRALVVVLAGWAPLVALTAVQGAWIGPDVIKSLLEEVGVHARYLIAAPMLVLAVAWYTPQLDAILRYFIDSGIVDKRDRERFEAAIRSTSRLLQSTTAWLVMIVLAYGLALATVPTHTPDQLPLWAQPIADIPRCSPAGWWHLLISLPLLLGLILGWLWRLVLWARLLWLIARLDLRLVPPHPDRCAGLGFLGHSVRAFAVVAFAFAAILAGRSAHLVLMGSTLPTSSLSFNVGAVVAVGALFVAPLLVYTPHLVRVRQSGMFAYDAFAHRVGDAFAHKWLSTRSDNDPLVAPDASAVADLSSVVANVHAIRFVPVDLKGLSTIVIALLLPFVPVVLLAFPIDVIWAQIKSLLM
jgi:hypothetical protein